MLVLVQTWYAYSLENKTKLDLQLCMFEKSDFEVYVANPMLG